LKKIVISTWLKKHFEAVLGEPVLGPVIMGVRFEQFFNPTKIFHQPRAIGMMVSAIEWKGTDDGMKALQLVANRHPDIRLLYFGWTARASELLFPAPGRFVHRPDQADLRHLYAACDIWVSPSWHEGGGPLPCQEASACGCAIVTTDVGAVPDIYTNGENALVSPPRQPEALAASICRLLEDEALLRRLSRSAAQHMQRFTWRAAAEQIAQYLETE
jgi:glycosyltransferase involved in cell wall biosynthesis